jgi:hypothetical protein
VSDAAAANGIFQSADDMLLPDKFGEGLRPEFPRDDLVAHVAPDRPLKR